MGDDNRRPRVDFLLGEHVFRKDAMSRAYSNLKQRINPYIDGKEWDFTIPSSLRRIPSMLYFGSGLYTIRMWMRRRKDSIVQVHNQRLGLILHIHNFSPSIIICYDIIEHVMKEYHAGYWYNAFIRHYITGTMKADIVVTPSRHTAEEIKRHFPASLPRLKVLHLGVDSAVFHPVDRRLFLRHFGLPEDKRYMLYVGSEQPRKNVPAVVRTFIRAQKEFPDLALLKVGKADEIDGYPVREEILKQLSSAGLDDRATFVDFVSDDMLSAAYSAADVFVFPSLYEGFGMPVLEAMACGTPVVASNTTSVPEVAGDAAILVPPKDEEALLEGTLRILRDDSLKAEFSARGRRRAAQFSWDVCAMKLLEIYRQLDPRG